MYITSDGAQSVGLVVCKRNANIRLSSVNVQALPVGGLICCCAVRGNTEEENTMGANTAPFSSSFLHRSLNPYFSAPSSPSSSPFVNLSCCREEYRKNMPLRISTSGRAGVSMAIPGTEGPAVGNGASCLEEDDDGQISSPSPSAAVDFLTLCRLLKTTKRKGWVNHGIKDSESIADHMYRMAAMALIAADVPGVSRDRCVKMAIVHDIAEAIVGDITPSDGIPKEEKSRRERKALDEMCRMLGGGLRAEEIKELWNEYENNSSLEANLVKDFDKVELILQALEYETEHGKILDEFFESTTGKFQTDVGKAWAAEILARRNRKQAHTCK